MADPQHYVYLYREPGSVKVKYVGYGKDPARAMSHTGTSHNAALRKWLERGTYLLSIAGPYRDQTEGLAVEAALISAVQPEFNVASGTGPKFRPLGVPPELADRTMEPVLSDSDIGRLGGGALLVYITPGQETGDGRTKPDPTTPDVEPVAANAEGWWQLGHHVPSWRDEPGTGPAVLVAVYGANLRHRFVLGSFEIDDKGWADARPDAAGLWRVPLTDRTQADVCGLRGRRLDVRFGRARWEHYRWVDTTGAVRSHTGG